MILTPTLTIEQQAIASTLPPGVVMTQETRVDGTWFTCYYESTELVLNTKTGTNVPRFSFSQSHRNPDVALNNLLQCLNSNNTGYSSTTQTFAI